MTAAKLLNLSRPEFRHIVLNRLINTAQETRNMVEGDHVLNPDYHGEVVKRAIKHAAVLIPVVERPAGLGVVFTKRTEKLKSHSGQVSFPGGKIDDRDTNAQLAALRETHEEVGVNPEAIEVLGQMPDYFTGSGYRISPVVGLVDSGASRALCGGGNECSSGQWGAGSDFQNQCRRSGGSGAR